ncbi:MAG: hypothetical protein ISS15_10870 [Alphaproteobacteria bacterium]|nr:hypothetical protein [Alphaproteobacteria bacterium]MBL6939992.1 hypothetical protein [Alphaproteobacteria bacterium]MBL7098152.1 hypothetical protein [Alphaproteobacteria bacterium]
MRTTLLIVAVLCAVATPALSASYTNDRFGYTLTYPDNTFAPQPEAENGDGRHFTALHGRADLAVWGGYNALNQSPSDIAGETAANCTSDAAPYRLVKPTVVVVSCLTRDGVVYRKTYIRGDTLTSFQLTYPASEKARWDAMIGKITLAPAK